MGHQHLSKTCRQADGNGERKGKESKEFRKENAANRESRDKKDTSEISRERTGNSKNQ